MIAKSNKRDDGPSPEIPSRNSFVSSKVDDTHLARLAMVYVRQSTAAQVLEHRESAEMQYNLKHRAVALGWHRERVITIDDDQGQSGSSAEHRVGFQRLLAEVGLNHVGIILGIEMSRLARSNKDWHQLLELCAIFGTLLADQDGLYDPGDYNDRLLLGLKGTMSEAELHILRNRLQLGKINKAQRGELFGNVPRGFVKLPSGDVTLDSDEEVQSVIRLCFEKFRELGSGRGLLRWLLEHNIRLPVRLSKGPRRGELCWNRATHGAVYTLLHHPFYAGAYCYGRTKANVRRIATGTGTVRVTVPMEDWQVLKREHLPSYITWKQYLTNLRQLTSNTFRSKTPGAPREGNALFGGLVRCGRCNKSMSVAYNDRQNEGRYFCNSLGPTKRCQSIQAREVDQLVEQQLLLALEPASIELSMSAIGEIENEQRRLERHWQQRLERANHTAERAQRQYQMVEPENRLVARSLEASWEKALSELEKLQEEHARFNLNRRSEISDNDLSNIQSLASSIPALWHAKTTTNQQRKTVARQLIDSVTLNIHNNSDVVALQVDWNGGFESHHEFRRSVLSYSQMQDFDRLLVRLRELRKTGATAAAIAAKLNDEGFRTARGKSFQAITVQTLMSRRDFTADKDQLVDPQLPDDHRWSIPQLVKELQLPTTTLCHWCRRGWVHSSKTNSNRWVVWANADELSRLRRLASYRRPSNRGEYPPELTTPAELPQG